MRTAHTAEAAFVEAFHELVDDTTIFAPTEKMKPIGADCAFSLELDDGTPMVRGLGVIRNAWPNTDSPFGRPGILIDVDQLTNSTEPIFQRLLAAHKAALAKPRNRAAPSTHQLWGPPAGPPTEEMIAVPEDEPEHKELSRRITREIRGVDPLDLTADAQPANDDGEIKDARTDPPGGRTVRARPPTLPGAVPPVPIPRPRLASAPVATIQPPMGEPDDFYGALARPRPWWMNARVGAVFAGGIVLGLLMSLVFGGGDPKPVAAAAAPPREPVAAVAAARPEPVNCPPPPEPAVLAATPVEEVAAPDAEPPKAKARAAKPAAPEKPKHVAGAAPNPVASAPKPTAIAETKPAATKPAATKPAATKPAATKPAATKPAGKVATKPAKTKSACSSLDCI